MKEKLSALYAEVWHNDPGMIKHCVGKTLSAFELRGKVVTVEKCRIQTNFCFGYSLSRYDDEDFDRANAMVRHAMSNENYFMRENHKEAGYAAEIDRLNDSRWKFYARSEYGTENLYYIGKVRAWEEIPEGAFELTDAEKSIYKSELTAAAKAHHKKIAAYLKRYGLSKVNAWSYWRDE